jgi:hypothetical protein
VKRRVLKKRPLFIGEDVWAITPSEEHHGRSFLLDGASWHDLGKRRKLLESVLKLWTGYLASGVEGIASVLIALAAIQAALQALVLFIKRGQGSIQSQEAPNRVASPAPGSLVGSGSGV